MRNAKYFLDKIRLWSGIFVFFYVCTHFLNHSLGLISLNAMEWGRVIFEASWRNPLMNYTVVTAAFLHGSLSMLDLLRRKSYSGLSSYQWWQIFTGVTAPLTLIGHLAHTKFAHEYYGIRDSYSYYLLTMDSPGKVFFILVVCGFIWHHGIIGMRRYLSLDPKRRKSLWLINAIGITLPLLALGGTVSAHREATILVASDAQFREAVLADLTALGHTMASWDEKIGFLIGVGDGLYLSVVILAFGSRAIWLAWRRRNRAVRVQYPDGSVVSIFPGMNLLEASLMGRIPHAHVCGGKGRCSTCRIRVYEGSELLEPPGIQESRVLRSIGAGADVRLACQTYPKQSVRIFPLLASDVELPNGLAGQRYLQGSDRRIAILFADLRGFTSFSEKKLPFDVVFVLNQYCQAIGRAVERRGGYVDKYIGDGAMALFGIESGYKAGCKQAIEAAWEIGQEMAALNQRLAPELSQPLGFGIGIHAGECIVGQMGYKHTSHLTAIGDAVNTASRLESMTKELKAELVVSLEVAQTAGMEIDTYRAVELAIRGRTEPLHAVAVDRTAELAVEELAPVVRVVRREAKSYA